MSNVNIIEVQNPTQEEMSAIANNIKVNYNFDVNVKEVEYKFKKSIDKDTGIETIRKPVVLAVPYPSVEGLVKILETGGAGLALLLEAAESIVNTEVRNILNDDITLTAASFPVDKVSWEAIANLPKAARRGGGIPKETWEAFQADYIAVMQACGKTVQQAANAAKLIANKFQQIKTNQPVLEHMVKQLSIYVEATPNMEDFAECVDFLLQKADTFLNVSEQDLLANL